jgi:hypothetical protein
MDGFTMRHVSCSTGGMRTTLKASVFISLALAGCGGTSGDVDSGAPRVDSGAPADSGTPADSGPQVDSGASGATDITNAIFTERSADCADYAQSYMASVRDIQRGVAFEGNVEIVASASSCSLTSNAIPNHDFNDASARFATRTAEITKTFVIPRNPTFAASNTALTLTSFNAVMLNGVVVDLLAAGCFGVGDGRIGCFNQATPWRYDPMSPLASFGTDAHHAHTQPDGHYHYHGDPLAMYADAAEVSPVIGFAADGFPIHGPYFNDGTTTRAAVSGYTLRTGTRPSGPGGTYDGTYVDDYEFTDAGDLDACNGMMIDGHYGYYVTRSYPWVIGCYRGTPDPSFRKLP